MTHSESFSSDTIAAVSTPAGASSQAVIRLSGSGALGRVAELAVAGPDVREAPGGSLNGLRLNVGDMEIPAVAAVFRAPRSYTREDMVELRVPGAPPLLGSIMEALVGSGGDDEGPGVVRWAGPGEFTLRAFLNGRIDLSQAEAVAGVIAASGEAEARASQRVLRGDLRLELDGISDDLVEMLALFEAALDFPDEDLPEVSPEVLGDRLRATVRRVEEIRKSSLVRSRVGDTLRVVIAGFPNAGKSSLFNAVLGRDRALCSPHAGTTRDPVRALVVQGGRRVEWIDLAGVLSPEILAAPSQAAAPELFGREAGGDDAIWEVVRRLTALELEGADLVLWVIDATTTTAKSLEAYRRLSVRDKLLVLQKADLLSRGERSTLAAWSEHPLLVSAHGGQGLEGLVARVLGSGGAPQTPGPGAAETRRFLLSAHQEAALATVGSAIQRAHSATRGGSGLEFGAADLREALRALEDLTGKVTPDTILGYIFSRFCVGK